MTMNLSNACTFFLTGTAMVVLPVVAPSLCPNNGFDGTSAREMWLQVMGLINASIGTGYFLRTGWKSLATALEVRLARSVPRAAKAYALPRNTVGSVSNR